MFDVNLRCWIFVEFIIDWNQKNTHNPQEIMTRNLFFFGFPSTIFLFRFVTIQKLEKASQTSTTKFNFS